jgi:hypothetical protein
MLESHAVSNTCARATESIPLLLLLLLLLFLPLLLLLLRSFFFFFAPPCSLDTLAAVPSCDEQLS